MKRDVIFIGGVLYNYRYVDYDICIENSYMVLKEYFSPVLDTIEEKHPDLSVWKRSTKSLRREWATHNLLYSLGIKRGRTKDVDLNYPCKWEWLYNIVGAIALILIK